MREGTAPNSKRNERSDKVISVHGEDCVAEAAREMRDHDVGCVVVTDTKGKIVGILSERDVVSRVIAVGGDPSRQLVRNVMTSDVAICPPETTVEQAGEIMMSKQIRHLPLVDGGIAVSMISSRDVMAYELQKAKGMQAAAEQVAMLSTSLRSLDIDEVVDMIVREVPKVFNADRCVLSFTEQEGISNRFRIKRNGCLCSEHFLANRDDAKKIARHEIHLNNKITDECRSQGGKTPSIVIPLDLSSKANSPDDSAKASQCFLCICGFDLPIDASDSLLWYKATLVRDILNANLSNAQLYRAARIRSLTDTLTGLGTRDLLEDTLEKACLNTRRYKRPFCVAIIDLDKFKSINDNLGHVEGDKALIEVAACMTRQKRATDVLARYGGDEFLLFLPETTREDAIILLERIRSDLDEFVLPDGLSFTISCGLVQQLEDSQVSANELIRRADIALYSAKNAGGDRIDTWEQISRNINDGPHVDSDKVKHLQGRIAGMSVQIKDMFIQSVWGLVQAIEAKDPCARSHSQHVTQYALGIAEALGISIVDKATLRRAAMIHDIGKIGVPGAILRKQGKMHDKERRIIEQHPVIGVRILEKMRFLEHEIPLVRHHHERWDGQGYPDGISGETIPLGARILSVADALDAITSDRAYSDPQSLDEAIRIIAEASGSQFDPKVIEGMIRWIEKVRHDLGNTDQLTTEDLMTSLKVPVLA